MQFGCPTGIQRAMTADQSATRDLESHGPRTFMTAIIRPRGKKRERPSETECIGWEYRIVQPARRWSWTAHRGSLADFATRPNAIVLSATARYIRRERRSPIVGHLFHLRPAEQVASSEGGRERGKQVRTKYWVTSRAMCLIEPAIGERSDCFEFALESRAAREPFYKSFRNRLPFR